MSGDPWAEIPQRVINRLGYVPEGDEAEVADAVMATVRPDYLQAVAERDAAVARAERLDVINQRLIRRRAERAEAIAERDAAREIAARLAERVRRIPQNWQTHADGEALAAYEAAIGGWRIANKHLATERARAERAEAERDAAREDASQLRDEIDRVINDRREAVALSHRYRNERDAAREDAERLADKGDHSLGCAVFSAPSKPCTCGWGEALTRHDALVAERDK